MLLYLRIVVAAFAGVVTFRLWGDADGMAVRLLAALGAANFVLMVSRWMFGKEGSDEG